MRDGRRWPLLREAAVPRATPVARPVEDVLKNPLVLVERLLDEERVIDNLELVLLRQTIRRRAGDQQCGDHQQAWGHERRSTSTSNFDAARVPIVIDA